MKLLPFALLLGAAAFASDYPMLKQVQAVYILPMGSGMDQYLANKITREGLFQVVTDPQKADTILTDRIGEAFEKKLDDLYPPPKPEKPEKAKVEGKDKDKDKAGKEEEDKEAASKADDPAKDRASLMAATTDMGHVSSFSRGKGTFFLVDRKSRAVIWSTYDRAPDNRSDTLDKKADQIVGRLRRDLKEIK